MVLFPMNFSDSSQVVAVEEQISSNLAGESVILQLRSGVYYGLNEVGAHIWDLIQQPKTIEAIRASLLAEYEVTPEVCQQDLTVIVEELVAAGLVEVRNGEAA